jgi:hypothetical protein
MKGHGTPLIPIGEPATPANTVEWRQSLSINDGDIDKMATWDVNQTTSWLQRMGLSIFCEQFQQHQISGEVLPLLTRDELREMGINFVGPRAHLLMHINKLKRQYNNAQRNKVIWEGQEALYETPCEACCDYTASCCMPDPPSKYTLTNSTLRIGEKVSWNRRGLAAADSRVDVVDRVRMAGVPDGQSVPMLHEGEQDQHCRPLDGQRRRLLLCPAVLLRPRHCSSRDRCVHRPNPAGCCPGHVADSAASGCMWWQHETCWMHVALGTAPEVIKMVRDAVEASQVVQRVNAVAT